VKVHSTRLELERLAAAGRGSEHGGEGRGDEAFEAPP
jgi:hypothetical protein